MGAYKLGCRISGPVDGKTKHYWGMPHKLCESNDGRPKELMAVPEVLVIDAENNGTAFLFRLKADGEVVGDTWHMSIEDAKDQAVFEYGTALSAWRVIPEGIRDIAGFLLGEKS